MSYSGSFVDSLFSVLVRRRTSISVGEDSRVRWRALRGTVGGDIEIGVRSIVNCRIAFDDPLGSVKIGGDCYIGSSLLVCHSSIAIGNHVIISWGVTIVDHDSHTIDWPGRSSDVADWLRGTKDWSRVAIRPVTILDKVWVGFGASILKGVVIGEGSVVAAQSVVTRDVEPYTLVGGNPARVIRHLR